jgi:hypothetical protein
VRSANLIFLCFSKEPYASFNTQSDSPITFSDAFEGLMLSRIHADSQAAFLSRSLVERQLKLVSFFCIAFYYFVFR